MAEGPPPARERLSTEELFRRHAAFVARVLYRMGVPAAELEDVVQEVFVVVHRLCGYVPGPASPKGFLASIAAKAAAGARRSERGRRTRRDSATPDDLASAAGSPVRMIEQREELTLLQAALNQLEPKLRALVILVELEGESCVDIAASQGLPVNTVYSQLHTARRKFHDAVRRMSRTRPASDRVRAEDGSP